MKKKKNTLTLMVIPHSGQKPTTINIPNYLLRFFSVFIFISMTLTVNWYFNYAYIKAENNNLQVVKVENEALMGENEALKDEYFSLYQDIEIIKAKILEIEQLEATVRQKNDFDPAKSYFSKSNQKILASIDGKGKVTASNLSLEETKDTINLLKDASEEKTTSLIELSEKLDEKNDVLSRIPSIYPTYGRLTSRFGTREDPFNRSSAFHNALDIANSYGTPIYASAAGKVIFAGYDGGYGRKVVVRHNSEFTTVYAHNSRIVVEQGETVKKGQIIAYMGSTGRSTGSHLHFEVLRYGKAVDPLQYISW